MARHHIDKLKKEFLYKNISVGHHNRQYSQADIVNSIINACRNKETIAEYCREPDSDTVYRRLNINLTQLVTDFQTAAKPLLRFMAKKYQRERWEILVDNRDKPFYGKHGDEHVIGTKEGKCFRFMQVTAVCRKGRVTCAVLPIKKGSNKAALLDPVLEWILKIITPFNFLADAGFGSGSIIKLVQKLRLPYIIRIRAIGEIQRYIQRGKTTDVHSYELTDKSRVYFHAKFGKGEDGKCWALATSHYRTQAHHLWNWYGRRWEIENSFKTQDRIELKTASRHCAIRLFCQMMTALLYTVWNVWRVVSAVYYTIKQFVRLVVPVILSGKVSKFRKLMRSHTIVC